jgi:hypothetical protein
MMERYVGRHKIRKGEETVSGTSQNTVVVVVVRLTAAQSR